MKVRILQTDICRIPLFLDLRTRMWDPSFDVVLGAPIRPVLALRHPHSAAPCAPSALQVADLLHLGRCLGLRTPLPWLTYGGLGDFVAFG